MKLFSRKHKRKPSVEVDDFSVRRHLANGKTEEARWEHLAEVTIMTNDRGPFEDDAFWVLIEEDGQSGCVIPISIPEAEVILDTVQKLPGFDNEKLIKAMSSAQNNQFILWKKLES